MFEVNKERRFDETQRMLYNIMVTLEEIRDRLPTAPPTTTEICLDVQKIEKVFELPKTENEKPLVKTICAYCGGTHENKGQALVCARKSQKNNKKG